MHEDTNTDDAVKLIGCHMKYDREHDLQAALFAADTRLSATGIHRGLPTESTKKDNKTSKQIYVDEFFCPWISDTTLSLRKPERNVTPNHCLPIPNALDVATKPSPAGLHAYSGREYWKEWKTRPITYPFKHHKDIKRHIEQYRTEYTYHQMSSAADKHLRARSAGFRPSQQDLVYANRLLQCPARISIIKPSPAARPPVPSHADESLIDLAYKYKLNKDAARRSSETHSEPPSNKQHSMKSQSRQGSARVRVNSAKDRFKTGGLVNLTPTTNKIICEPIHPVANVIAAKFARNNTTHTNSTEKQNMYV